MTSINTNTAALVAQLQATKSISQLQRSTDRISSGLRVNSAADDAAGLSIANKLTSQIRGISTALKNSADAISLIDTALAGTTEGIKISQRIRELAVQMSNGTYSPEDRVNAQFEINDLILEIDRLSSETSFNNIKLLDGSFSQTMRVGDGLEELLDVTIDNPLSLTGISALNTAVGSSEAILKSLTSGTGVSNFNIPAIAAAQITEMSGDITGNSRINLAETNAPTGTSTLEFLPNRLATGQSDFDTPETSEATGSSTLDIRSTSNVTIKPKENQSGNFIARGRSVLDIASSRTASGSSSLDYLVNSPATETSSITAGVPLTSDAVVADGGASTLNPLQFFNGDFSFSTGSGTNLNNGNSVAVDGWDIYLEQIALSPVASGTALSANIDGHPTPADDAPAGSAGDDTAATIYEGTPVTFSYEIAGNEITLATNEITAPSNGIIHGPYIVSDEAISLNEGDVFSFDWESTGDGGDVTDVYAYLQNVADGSTIELLDFTSPGVGAVPKTNVSYTLTNSDTGPGGQGGLYKFVFISGAYDGDGGGIVGSEVKVSNVSVTENSGLSTTTTATVTLEAQETESLRIARGLLTELDATAADNSYQITGQDAGYFTVDFATGDILAGPLLRATKTSYNFDVRYNRPGGGYHIESVTLNLTPALAAETTLNAQEGNRINIERSDLSLLDAYYDTNKGGVFSIHPDSADQSDFTIDPSTGVIQSARPLDFFTTPIDPATDKKLYKFDVVYEVEGNVFRNYVTLNLSDTLKSTANLSAEEATEIIIDPATLTGTQAYISENQTGSLTLTGDDAGKFNLIGGKYVSNQPLLLAEQESYDLKLEYLATGGSKHVETINLTLTEALQSVASLNVTSGDIAKINAAGLDNISTFASGGAGVWSLEPTDDSNHSTDNTLFTIDPQTGAITSNAALSQGVYSFDIRYSRQTDNQSFIETVVLNAKPPSEGLMSIQVEEANNILITNASLLDNIEFFQTHPEARFTLTGNAIDNGIFQKTGDGDIENIADITLDRTNIYARDAKYEFDIEFIDDATGNTHVESVQIAVTEALQATSSLTVHESDTANIQRDTIEKLNIFAARDRYRGSYEIDASVNDGALFQVDENGAISTTTTLDYDDRADHSYRFLIRYIASDGRVFNETVEITLTDTLSSTAALSAEEGQSVSLAISELSSSQDFKENKPGGIFSLSGTNATLFDVNPDTGEITSKPTVQMTRDIGGVYKDTYEFQLEYQLAGGPTHTEAVTLTLTEALQSSANFESVEAETILIYLDRLTKLRSFASRDGRNGNFAITGDDSALFEFNELGNIQSFRTLNYDDRADHTYRFNVEYTETPENGGETFTEAVTLTLTDTLSSSANLYAEEGGDIHIKIADLASSNSFKLDHPGGNFTLAGDGTNYFEADQASGSITLKNGTTILQADHPSIEMELIYTSLDGLIHTEEITLNLIGPLNAAATAISAEADQVQIDLGAFSKLSLFTSQNPNGRFTILGDDAQYFTITDNGKIVTNRAIDFDERPDHSYSFDVSYATDNSDTFTQTVNLTLTDTYQSAAKIYAEAGTRVSVDLATLQSSSTFKSYKRGGSFTLSGADADKFSVDRRNGLISSNAETSTLLKEGSKFAFDLVYSLADGRTHIEAVNLEITKTQNNRSQSNVSVVEATEIEINLKTLEHLNAFAKEDGFKGTFELGPLLDNAIGDYQLFSIDGTGRITSTPETAIDFDAGQQSFQLQVRYLHSNGIDVYQDDLTIDLVNDPLDDGGEVFAEISVDNVEDARETVSQVEVIISRIISTQSQLGATRNALESNIRRLSVNAVYAQSARSQILDADIALETSKLVKSQLLNNAALAMLANATTSLKNQTQLLFER
mgnify:FL=1